MLPKSYDKYQASSKPLSCYYSTYPLVMSDRLPESQGRKGVQFSRLSPRMPPAVANYGKEYKPILGLAAAFTFA